MEVGGYRLIEALGQGGMGLVWRAEHARSGRPVALKVVTQASPAALGAFRREIRAAASLSHPAIVPILDAGTLPEGLGDPRLVAGAPYAVMELLSGVSLVPELGRIPWTRVRAHLLTLLDALASAHARGVLHRDVKPENVLLDDVGALRLVDFGLAHLLERSDDGARVHGGTPAYMAPEQVRGVWRQFGPWTDLYALGGLGWALACGAPPFVANGRRAAELLRAQVDEPLPPFRPLVDAPPGLGEWLARLLAKSPFQRFDHAADAAEALRALGGEPAPVEATEARAATPRIPPRRSAPPPVDEARSTWHAEDPFDDDEPTLLAPPEREVAPVQVRALPAWRREGARRVSLPGSGLGLLALRPVPPVGREPEQEALWTALDRVRRTQRTELVRLRGPEGADLPALAGWLGDRAAEVGGAEVVRLSWGPERLPRHGVASWVAHALGGAGLTGMPLVAHLRQALARWEAADLAGPLAGVVASPGRRLSGGPLEVVVELLCRMARRRAVLLTADGPEWEFESVLLIERLVERGGASLIVTLERPSSDAPGAVRARLDALAERAGAFVRPLGPVSRAELLELVEQLAGLAPPLAEEVASVSGHAPATALWVAEELARSDALVPGPGGFVLRPGEGLDADGAGEAGWWARVVASLVDAQPGWATQLELAALLGRHVERGLLEGACAAFGTPFAPAAIEQLLDRGLAEAEGDHGFTFARVGFREALLERARGERWAALNRACADAIGARRDGASSLRRARHFRAAGVIEGAVDGFNTAATSLIWSADAAEARHAIDEAFAALEESGLPPENERWGHAMVTRGALEARFGSPERAAEVQTEAWAASRKHGWTSCMMNLLATDAAMARHREGTAAAAALLREAAALGRSLAHPGVPSILGQLSDMLHDLGRVHEARALLLEVQARSVAPEMLARRVMATCSLATNARWRGDLEEAGRLVAEAGAQLGDRDLPYIQAYVSQERASLALAVGDPDRADAEAISAIALMEAIGTASAAKNSGFIRLEVAFIRGDRIAWEAAWAWLERFAASRAEVVWEWVARLSGACLEGDEAAIEVACAQLEERAGSWAPEGGPALRVVAARLPERRERLTALASEMMRPRDRA